jgi:hypothetical protein
MSLHTVPPHRAVERVVVHRDLDVVARLVQLEVERDAERHRPVAFEEVAVEVDADDVARADLVPREQPRVAQQRAVAQVVRDVPGEVVVVALPPQGAREQDDLLLGREIRQQLVGGGSEGVHRILFHAGSSSGRTTSGSGWR